LGVHVDATVPVRGRRRSRCRCRCGSRRHRAPEGRTFPVEKNVTRASAIPFDLIRCSSKYLPIIFSR
jgi:hypothetical protein